jgi:glycosyltransferase involved in cell wall biosynthesis
MLNNIGDEEKKENNKLKVSIIIPCRNEEKYISQCIDSLLDNSYPKNLIEIIIIDGMSEDNTREIIKKYIEKYPFIKLLNNSKRIVPTALNIGIKEVRGDIVIRIDAHSIYPSNYIEKLVLWIRESKTDNVGGIFITKPGAETAIARAIAVILSHPFGVGNGLFRIGIKEPKYVDTVPFGAYRREVFNKIGLFNERLIRNQDLEFNLRLKKTGGKILLVPEIVSYYYARADLKGLFKQNFWNGFWVIYSTKFAKMPFSVRHLIPFFFLISLIGSFILSFIYKYFLYLFSLELLIYLIVNIFFSLKISFQRGFKYFIPVMLSFATLHFSYGFGSIGGLIKLLWEWIRKNIL